MQVGTHVYDQYELYIISYNIYFFPESAREIGNNLQKRKTIYLKILETSWKKSVWLDWLLREHNYTYTGLVFWYYNHLGRLGSWQFKLWWYSLKSKYVYIDFV